MGHVDDVGARHTSHLDEGLLQRRRPDGDVRHAREGVRQREEGCDRGAPEVEVDQGDLLARAGQRHGEVCDRGRLALLLERARDHDRTCAAIEVHELEIGTQHSERLRLSAVRAGDHHQPVPAAQRSRRSGDPREKRRLEPVADLRRGAHARIEGIAGECEPDAQHEAEHHAEHDGAFRARLDLRGAARGAQKRGVCRLQRLHGAERLLVLDEPRDERRAPEPGPVELLDPSTELLAGGDDRGRVELPPVLDELLRVDRGELRGRLGVAVGDVEVQDVRIGRRRDVRAAEERAGGQPRNPGGLDDAVGDVRRHRDLRLRLGDPLRILVDGREILDPGETAREVLVLEQDL